jgi:hypothetical protein
MADRRIDVYGELLGYRDPAPAGGPARPAASELHPTGTR